ncbi:MAG TPA: hypothetical protein VL282_10675 [Tepidisphaeraceae bacterium]|nr:hypothetical protein [Tepidisphaeraceae bacterium]
MLMKRNSSSVKKAPAAQYLDLVGKKIAGIEKQVPNFTSIGEKMASSLLAGGALFTPPVARFWPSEFGGRAGGLMGLRPSNYEPQSKKDVAYFALPRRWDDRSKDELKRIAKSKAQLFAIGRPEDVDGLVPTSRFAAFTGGAAPDEGLFGLDEHRPLAPLRKFEQFVRGWLTAGEMIGACTRAGKMPIIWMSVWLEGAFARNATFFKHDNLREPWFTSLFHDAWYVPPLAPGYTSGEFLALLKKIHGWLIEQLRLLAQAGAWLGEAKKSKKRLWTVAVGHSYPEILELPDPKKYPIEWGHSYSDLRKALPSDLKKGDVVLHMGYAPVQIPDIKAILSRGIRLIHSSPYGRPADLKNHENFMWLDLPWRPADATVDVPGYGVRILPMSSSAHTMAYFAILAEMAGRLGWK